jgi:mannose-1-phosphate guanylyltransferase/mannose-6-phosphate isomerase
MKITPVILCGGSGTRLWPLSRKSYPKQFVPITGDHTLFQKSALRMRGSEYEAPIVITNSDFRFIVTEQLQNVGIDPGVILIEPAGRNTAPAILAAALYVARRNPDATLLVSPSDHLISDVKEFHEAVNKGAIAAKDRQLVTFGVKPTHAETAYGYLELVSSSHGDTFQLKRFVEKPSLERATEMIESGTFLWNAGIFLFRASDIIAAFEIHAASLVQPVISALDTGYDDLGFYRLGSEPWNNVSDISIDYAIMEKAENLSVVPLDAGWSDLGGWDAVWREAQTSKSGLVTSGNVTAIDCTDTLIRSENDSLEIVGIGLTNILAIAMSDAVLVADMSRAQDVKKAVDFLRTKNVAQANNFPKDYRPWGWFESLTNGETFQVKRIFVKPEAALSLQSHRHRAEHWIVVSGTAEVTINDDTKLISENESVYIPKGAVHRLRNPGKVPINLIEVQTGSYLGEDDIVRYEDLYAREQKEL